MTHPTTPTAAHDAPGEPDRPTLISRSAAGPALDAATLYALLALRVDVFIVEQQAIDPELDHRDLDSPVTHVWAEVAGRAVAEGAASPIAGTDRGVVAGARLRVEPGSPASLERVVVHPAWRGRGVGSQVVERALALTDGPVVCKAQEHLVDWYARFGFAADGATFLWAQIPHVPLRRAGRR